MDSAAFRYGNFRRILFCTDFSPNADFAFGFAVEAAQRNAGSTLYLLHVIPEPEAQFWKGYIYDTGNDPDAKAKADIDAKVAQTYLAHAPAGLDLRCEYRVGNAAQKILEFAEQAGIDLIVIGRQGHRAVTALFFGNVVTKVARHAGCAVMIVPLDFGRRSAGAAPAS